MDQSIKAMGEIEKLVNECTSQTLLKLDNSKLNRIAELVNSSGTIPKQFAALIKTKLAQIKFPRSQIHLLNIIEMTTARCGQQLHNEYNSKIFLQQFNGLFNQKNLPAEVLEKALQLVAFWDSYFEQKKDILPNFNWYYNSLAKRGGQFPEMKPSEYNKGNQGSYVKPEVTEYKATKQPSTQEIYSTPLFKTGKELIQIANQRGLLSDLGERETKLFNDLVTVYENVTLAVSLIAQNDRETLNEVIPGLQSTKEKLSSLPDKLEASEQYFLQYFTLGILYDLDFTLDRAINLNSDNKDLPFESQAVDVVQRFGATEEESSSNQFEATNNNVETSNRSPYEDNFGFNTFGTQPTNKIASDPFAAIDTTNVFQESKPYDPFAESNHNPF